MLITQSELKSILHYNPDTGVFTRKTDSRGGRWVEGTIAGCRSLKGYVLIHVCGKRYTAHRLAWLYEYGYFPKEIDHINHKAYDNRMKNLREVNSAINNKNRPKNKNNASGYTGVSWDKERKRWTSRITVNYKTICLGRFKDIKNAVSTRKEANIKYGFHENHGSL